MRVYLAGRVSRLEELAGYALDLRNIGAVTTASWLNPKLDLYGPIHANRGGLTTEQRGEIAIRDLKDIGRADLAILFTEPHPNTSRGNGRLVEFGYAMGLNKHLWVVGPLENLFACIPTVRHFEDWKHAYTAARRVIAQANQRESHPATAGRSQGTDSNPVL